jgi:hypothetical protein
MSAAKHLPTEVELQWQRNSREEFFSRLVHECRLAWIGRIYSSSP